MSKEETKLVDQKIHGIFIEKWQHFFYKEIRESIFSQSVFIGEKGWGETVGSLT